MANPGQPTISPGATGEAVRRLQRALRRTPNLGLVVDGVFGPATEAAVKEFQQGAGLVVDGIVGPQTWAALPNGAPMPTLQEGSTGAVVKSLQQVLERGIRPMEHVARSGRWEFRPRNRGLGQGLSGLGRSDGRRHCWRSNMGGVAARGQRDLGKRCRSAICRLSCSLAQD
jgi:hypothetical protein